MLPITSAADDKFTSSAEEVEFSAIFFFLSKCGKLYTYLSFAKGPYFKFSSKIGGRTILARLVTEKILEWGHI